MSIHTLLKDATRADHLHLEAKLDLIRKDFGLCDYVKLLAGFYGYYIAFENDIVGAPCWNELQAELSSRLKVGVLRSDLAALGLSQEEIDALPICPAAWQPAISSTASVLGAMYVTEGSTLGGKFLSKHFAQTLAVTPSMGGAFFASYGAAIGQRWTSFLQLLEARVSPQDAVLAVEAAKKTFCGLESWLVGPGNSKAEGIGAPTAPVGPSPF